MVLRGTAPALAYALLCATAIVGVAWFTVVAEGFAATDESWFLQVVTRLQSGEALYRDVYFNATPLSIYVTLGLTSIFPAELVVVRSIVVAALVVTVVFCWLVCRELRAERFAPWLLVCAWTQPAPYTPVSMAFFAAAFYAVVVWMRRVQDDHKARHDLAVAGVAAGLCFSAKQNIGLYCLAAVLVSILIVRGRRAAAVRAVLAVVAGFLLTAVTIALPVYASGGFDRFVVYCFDKATYLRMGGVPYAAVVERVRAVTSGAWNLEALMAGYREFAFLLPPVAFALLAVACLRSRSIERHTALVVTTFVGAGYLVVYPQQGGSSIMFSLPVVIVGLAYGWSIVQRLVSRPWARAVPIVLTLLFIGQIGLRFARHTTTLLSTDYVTSDIPHFRGIRARGTDYCALRDQARLLSSFAADRSLFLIGPNSGFFYLAADLRNPAPFDFPYVSVFGRGGQQEVISRIMAGEIRSVFIFSTPMHRQAPTLLRYYVETSMSPVRREALGVLYR